MEVPWKLSEPWLRSVVKRIQKISENCRKRGMQLLYHNHDFEFQKVDGKYILDWIYDLTRGEELQTELDTYWIRVGGEEPAVYVRKYTGRSPVVHLKDYVGQKTENINSLIGNGEEKETRTLLQLRPVGYCCQDVATLVQAAVNAGAQWVIVEQDNPSMDKDSLGCAKMSTEYLLQLKA